jgi:hypothetical protein
MGRLRLGLVGLVVAGCSGSVTATVDGKVADVATADTGPDLTDGAHSGARLKITYWAFADGTRAWNAFYDSQRKENCYINGPWPDGGYYCEPDASSVEYSDAGCSQPIGLVYKDPNCPQPAPGYIVDNGYSATTCTYGPSHLYLRGAKLGLSQYYYKNSNGTCGGPVVTSGYDFYAAGAEITLSSLAKVTIGAPTGTGTLTERFITSTDGLQFPWSVHDAGFGSDCYVQTYDQSGANAVCTPDNARYASYNHDSACSIPELTQTHACPAPQYAEYYPPNLCPSDPPKFYSVGSMVTSAPLYYDSGTACTATTGSTTVDYYTTTQQLSLKSLTRTPDSLPSHRIQLIHDTTTDGLNVRDWSLWDQQQGVECYPTPMPDGSTRCYPYGSYIDTYYKDAMCTQTIDLAYISTGPTTCGSPYVPKIGSKYVPPPTGSCAYSYEIHTLGSAYNGPIYTNYSTCTAYTVTDAKMYTVGAVVDPTSFATATIVTDQ